MTPTPTVAPIDRLKAQLLMTMSGLYLKSEFRWLTMTAMAILNKIGQIELNIFLSISFKFT